MAYKKLAHHHGFTIVELLVVIVVIGILAAITIVSYMGIQQKAVASSLQSDLSNASQQLKIFQVEHNAFPNDINDCPTPAVGNLCLKLSSGNVYGAYQVNNNVNPQSFRLTANNNAVSYHITNDSTPAIGSSGTLTSGLVAYYPFDGNAKDYSVNNNDGITNGTTLTSGPINQAYLFNGTNSYFQAPGVSNINTLNSTLTFSFWVKGSDYSSHQSILSRRTGCNNDHLFNIFVQSNQVHLGYYTSPTYVDSYSNYVLTNGSSYFVTIVKPFGQLGMVVYVNGIQQTVAGDSAIPGASDNTAPIIIGAQWSGDACYSMPITLAQIRGFFTGSIDDVRIYNRALSSVEVYILYNL